MRTTATAALLIVGTLAIGCAGNGKLVKQQRMEIEALQGRVGTLEQQVSEERTRSAQMKADLEKALVDSKDRERILLEQVEGKAMISLPDAVLFALGSARLTKEGQQVLDRIGKVLKDYPDREIFIEGHTDNVPIAVRFQNRYRSNWELSSARAHAVLHYLSDHHGIPGKQLAVLGYGEYRPVADNATKEHRSTNRRVVIRVGGKLASEAYAER